MATSIPWLHWFLDNWLACECHRRKSSREINKRSGEPVWQHTQHPNVSWGGSEHQSGLHQYCIKILGGNHSRVWLCQSETWFHWWQDWFQQAVSFFPSNSYYGLFSLRHWVNTAVWLWCKWETGQALNSKLKQRQVFIIFVHFKFVPDILSVHFCVLIV